MPEPWQRAGFGLYLHWPFCQAKCPYCDFNSHVVASIDQKAWERAYLSEIDRVAAETQGRILSTVFFGGGTPSLMSGELVSAIIERITSSWTTANDLEITLEANPTSVEAERFAAYRDAGVNRVSLGLQALNDPDLKALGRLHSAAEGRAALETAMGVFDRVSFDLIYARQHQQLSDWTTELKAAIGFGATHMSLYQLTIEDGTAFGDRHARGMLKGLPDEDLGADMYEATQNLMSDAGFEAYEVSNHAKHGQIARHNMIYWNGGDYAGIGPGAHGRLTLGGNRYATTSPLSPAGWMSQVAKTGSGEAPRENLSGSEILSERLMMGLRLADGVDVESLGIAELPENLTNNINGLVGLQLLEMRESFLRTTPKGRPLLNAILREILA